MTALGSVVNLCWINGNIDYCVGMLVIVTFLPMYLPEHLWVQIEPLYINEDKTDNSVENLSYRFFSGLLECETSPGFYYIPHYTKYAMSRNCMMVTAENGKVKSWHIVKPDLMRNSKGGYLATRVINTPGVSGVLLRHRAMCLTFKPIEDAQTINLIVNHLDGIPGNDDLDNLEWTTYAVNNQHAHDNGLTGTRRTKVLVKDLRNDEIVIYRDTKAAAKALGFETTAPIRYRLRHKLNTLFDDYLQMKLGDGSEWHVIDMSAEPEKFLIGSRMAARNVFTGDIVEFGTFEEGSKLTGVDRQTIMIHIRDRQIMPFKGFNFSYYSVGMEWPSHSELHLKAYKRYPVRTPDPIIFTDTISGEDKFFESRNEMATFLSISGSYATQITINGWLFAGRFLSRYYNLREFIKVPSSWKA